MTPSGLEFLGRKLFDRKSWQTRMAEWLGVDPSTVRRWLRGAAPIPGPVERALLTQEELTRVSGKPP